jgi:Ion channel
MISGLRERKYLALLAGLVFTAVLEPASATWSQGKQILGSLTAAVIIIGVFLVVFEQRWERGLAFLLVIFIFAANIVHEVLPDPSLMGAIVFHCLATVFLAFAVAVILKRIFRRQTIRTDDVIGALCGYLLAAAAWGNAYGLVYLLWPGSFRVADAVAWRLDDWHLQRFLFDYFSVMTLTSLGYNDITPASSLAYSLRWLESVFGQFYIAVVVAQLVGLRLAQVINRDRPGS